MQRNLIFLLQQIALRLQSEGTLGCITVYFKLLHLFAGYGDGGSSGRGHLSL